jgi:inorganic pyrophosphatase
MCHPANTLNKIRCFLSDELFTTIENPFYSPIQEISDLPQHFTKEVDYFFSIYKNLEGKKLKTFGYKRAERAENAIMKGYQLHSKKRQQGL